MLSYDMSLQRASRLSINFVAYCFAAVPMASARASTFVVDQGGKSFSVLLFSSMRFPYAVARGAPRSLAVFILLHNVKCWSAPLGFCGLLSYLMVGNAMGNNQAHSVSLREPPASTRSMARKIGSLPNRLIRQAHQKNHSWTKSGFRRRWRQAGDAMGGASAHAPC